MKMLALSKLKLMKPVIIPKVWGFEEIIYNTKNYCFKYLHLQKGFQCSVHYHKLKTETFYLQSGKIVIQLVDQKYIMGEKDFITIYPCTCHRFIGLKNSVILEVSTQDFEDDSYRIENQLSGSVDINEWVKS